MERQQITSPFFGRKIFLFVHSSLYIHDYKYIFYIILIFMLLHIKRIIYIQTFVHVCAYTLLCMYMTALPWLCVESMTRRQEENPNLELHFKQQHFHLLLWNFILKEMFNICLLKQLLEESTAPATCKYRYNAQHGQTLKYGQVSTLYLHQVQDSSLTYLAP